MTQPTAYARAFSFTDWTANFPAIPQPGVRLDTEFNAIATTFAQYRTNLALLQRDDGHLANNSVGADQISPEVTLGLRSVADWATAEDYLVNDAVWRGGALYRCIVEHTAAAAFATDLAALKWALVYDFADAIGDAIDQAVADADITIDGNLVPTKAGNNTLTGNNILQGTTLFSALPTVAVGGATTAGDYAAWKPTDYGAGKPGVFLRKKALAGEWELELDDGAGGSGTLDIVVASATALTLNGAPLATAASVTALETDIRRARNFSLTAR